MRVDNKDGTDDSGDDSDGEVFEIELGAADAERVRALAAAWALTPAEALEGLARNELAGYAEAAE